MSQEPIRPRYARIKKQGAKSQEQTQTPVCRRDNDSTGVTQAESPDVRTRTEERNWAQKEVRFGPFKEVKGCAVQKKFL